MDTEREIIDKNGRKLTKHHIIPRSRGGGNGDNVVMIPDRYHVSWHALFGNMTPYEVVKFINTVFYGDGRKRRKIDWSFNDWYLEQLKLQNQTTVLARKSKTISKRKI